MTCPAWSLPKPRISYTLAQRNGYTREVYLCCWNRELLKESFRETIEIIEIAIKVRTIWKDIPQVSQAGQQVSFYLFQMLPTHHN